MAIPSAYKKGEEWISCYEIKSDEDVLRKNAALQKAIECLSKENPDIASVLEILKVSLEHPTTKDEAEYWENFAHNERRKEHFEHVMYELVGRGSEGRGFLPNCEIDVENCKAGIGHDPHIFPIKCPNISKFNEICNKYNKEEESFWTFDSAENVLKKPNPAALKIKKNDQALFYRYSFVGVLRPVALKQA
jgi:hypothetical protein